MKSVEKARVLGTKDNFLGLDKKHSSYDTSKIIVVPAPYERTVSYGKGTKRGPAAILKASHFVEFYDEELARELCFEIGIVTLAPLNFGKKHDAQAIKTLHNTVHYLMQHDKFVVTLGGEHTISQGPIAAYNEKYRDLSVLQIDAHSDLRQRYQGTRFSHASVMARVCEFLDPTRIVQVGIRAQCIEEAQYIQENGISTFYAHNIKDGKPTECWDDEVVSKLTDHVYITFDVDGLDPSIMPSTGTPEPNGLQWAETMRLLRKLGEQKTIVGFDVVELAPLKDISYPDLTAAKLTYKLMNYASIR
jgi:agmatinase